jgi:drug/metabolite transporter (DMT)-like permease
MVLSPRSGIAALRGDAAQRRPREEGDLVTDLASARASTRERGIRWGFAWALWCAVLWGAWYIPGSALYFEEPFAALSESTTGFLKAAAVISMLNAIAVLLAMYIWAGVLGKLKDYGRTIVQVGNISKWLALAAVFGGPMAIYGSFLAIGYVGAAFGAVAALCYPVIGAALARVWLKEKITARAAMGIGIIVVGAVFIFTPGLSAELSGGSSQAWIGYLGGLMAIFGWGIEGVIAGRTLDVTDPDVSLTVRFTAETFYWVVLIVPVAALFLAGDLYSIAWAAITNPINLLWLALAGMTFGFCYVAWYKSFPLIGVGRGQAIAALYGPFALVWLTIATLALPSWEFVVGGLLAVVGSFVLFTERRDVLEVIRAVPGLGRSSADKPVPVGVNPPNVKAAG